MSSNSSIAMGDEGGIVLRLHGLHHSYPQAGGVLNVLRGVDATIQAGEKVALCGPSGSGKSTLLHLAGLLEAPSAGNIEIFGHAVDADDATRTKMRRGTIGFVFQFHHLLPEFTALENVAMPCRINGYPVDEAEAKAYELLTQFGLSDRAKHLPSQLSGGEQQRVAIARALVLSPRILLADEPTGSLDQETGKRVSDYLFEACRVSNMALLLATHNEALAAQCDRVLRFVDGRIV
jgi:lipoprotein-releasing system ATP-binding protein